MVQRVRVFLDTSVILAAVLSPQGASRLILRLGEIGALSLWIGRSILIEAEEVVRRKAPHTLPVLALLLAGSGIEVGHSPTPAHIETARSVVAYPPDALVLAEALAVAPDWFVTLDRKHFLSNPATADLPFSLGLPGDLLAFLRGDGSARGAILKEV